METNEEVNTLIKRQGLVIEGLLKRISELEKAVSPIKPQLVEPTLQTTTGEHDCCFPKKEEPTTES